MEAQVHPLSPRWSKTAAAVAVLALGACAPEQTVSSNPEVQDFPSAARSNSNYSSVSLSGEVSLKVGTSTKLSVRTSSRSRGSIRWQSSNPSAATVSSQGNVTGRAVGTTYVTASGFAVSETYLVSVTPAYTLTGFTVSPTTGTALAPGQTRQFSTQQLWSDGQTRNFGVTYTATGGSISSSGLFTAGSVAGSFMVIANCLCGALDTAFVTVELPAQLTKITVSPKTVSLNAGATQQFGATANWSTGATTLPPITWSATGGSISTNGLYTAPTSAGTYRVIVAHSGGTLRDTATVTVTASSGGEDVTPPPTTPIPSVFGPGANAQAWQNKTIYTQELFESPVPVHYGSANSAGFKGWQGFDGYQGSVTYASKRVSYPTVSTPLGTKKVLEITYPGSTTNIAGANQTTAIWPTDQSYAIRVTGTWTGTLLFERSPDGGATWSAVSLRGARAGTGATSTSGSQTTTNGVWVSDNGTVAGGKFRVRATSWGGGTATVAVGMQGGESPARMSAGSFSGNPTRIYTRVLVYVDPNWTNGGNTATKFFFFSQSQGNNHYASVIGGMDNESVSGPSVSLQQTSFRNMFSSTTVQNGTWLDLEYVFIANTPGSSNGIARAWINGVETMNVSNVLYFASGTTAGFQNLFMDPTYGGGEAPPPRNVFFRIAGWYRESAQ